MAIRVNIEKSNMQDYYDLRSELQNKFANSKLDVHPGILRIDNEDGTALACNVFNADEINEWNFEENKK